MRVGPWKALEGIGLANEPEELRDDRLVGGAVRERVFREGEANRLAPATVTPKRMVAGGRCGHGVEPPAFLRCKPLPVGNGGGREGGVGVFDGPLPTVAACSRQFA